MTPDLLTKAGSVLSDLVLFDAGPVPATGLQLIVAGWVASYALGAMAALFPIPRWVRWFGFALLAAKELTLDIPGGSFSSFILADANLDLALPLLGYISTAILIERFKP